MLKRKRCFYGARSTGRKSKRRAGLSRRMRFGLRVTTLSWETKTKQLGGSIQLTKTTALGLRTITWILNLPTSAPTLAYRNSPDASIPVLDDLSAGAT